MVNPVFVNELRQNMFRRKPVLGIGLWALATIFLIWLSQFASLTRYPLSWLPVFALPLIVPPFAAGTFAKEYEQQTWQDLYLTRLTNAQVVIGKFCAALLQVGIIVISFFPAMILVQLYQAIAQPAYGNNLLGGGSTLPGWWTVVLGFKLILSASLYVLLGMTCSRYSSNRRAALVWSYVALFLYGLLGTLVWTMVGAEVARDDGYAAYTTNGTYIVSANQEADPLAPGFMSGLHLTFCSVVGIGTFILLWVSMSEQRGYKSGGNAESNRAWQPVRHRRSTS
jgi:ABC-type transport system involved in multi-copper enzyme maturation permease subunit